MKRNSFVASAVALFPACFVRVAGDAAASGWPKPSWRCNTPVVWLDVPSGVYYRKGDARYGRTKRGAYACEKQAVDAGNRAS